LLIVTAIGADPDSFFYYNKVKGQLEKDLRKLNFWGLHICQPSLLLGDRKELRAGESFAAFIGKGVAKVTGGFLKKYLPIKGEEVAAAMVYASNQLNPGAFVYTSDQLKDMAGQYFK